VVGGAATIQGQGGPAVIVNQSSSSAIINWNTFNIGVNESVRFNQPGASSVVLNRVTGGLGPSEILGTLTANGRVFVINRDGILFGPGSVVNTAGFLATTHDIKNSDFMAGRYNFNIPGRPDASIVNQGRINRHQRRLCRAGRARRAQLRHHHRDARHRGARVGQRLHPRPLRRQADHARGQRPDRRECHRRRHRPAAQVASSPTRARSEPMAGGSSSPPRRRASWSIPSSTTSGVIKANSIGRHNGMIVLSAATGASKSADAATQSIKISGTLAAAGKKKGTQGGTILVTGEDIKLASARLDASGRVAGGKVLIGGDWGGGNPNKGLVANPSAKLESFVIPTATTVSVDAATTINASATGRGNGGKVVLWSDSQTTFAGTILARGGAKAGDGGFVEVSSHGQLAFTGRWTRAHHAAERARCCSIRRTSSSVRSAMGGRTA